jgi:hypothetical protein
VPHPSSSPSALIGKVFFTSGAHRALSRVPQRSCGLKCAVFCRLRSPAATVPVRFDAAGVGPVRGVLGDRGPSGRAATCCLTQTALTLAQVNDLRILSSQPFNRSSIIDQYLRDSLSAQEVRRASRAAPRQRAGLTQSGALCHAPAQLSIPIAVTRSTSGATQSIAYDLSGKVRRMHWLLSTRAHTCSGEGQPVSVPRTSHQRVNGTAAGSGATLCIPVACALTSDHRPWSTWCSARLHRSCRMAPGSRRVADGREDG